MKTLIRQQRLYEQVYYEHESQFLSIVKSELPKILPRFSILDFSPFIISDEGSRRRPDLAFIARNYEMWAVVEVELENHSLNHHVIPQIQTFAKGHYDESHADLIHRKDPTLNLGNLRNLTTFYPPIVSVVVNSSSVLDDGWDVLESEYSARLTFFETFRSPDGDVVFSLSGYMPTPRPRSIIGLKKHKMLNALVCNRTHEFSAAIGEEIVLYWRERSYTWEVLRTQDTVVLLPPGGFTVRPDRNYEADRISDRTYQLREL